jgi:hypothetical protein
MMNIRLTPTEAAEALELRFRKGQQTYGNQAWNATSTQHRLGDRDWILDRIEHAHVHLDIVKNILLGKRHDDFDDDGAAIMWAGAMIHMAMKIHRCVTQPTGNDPTPPK